MPISISGSHTRYRRDLAVEETICSRDGLLGAMLGSLVVAEAEILPRGRVFTLVGPSWRI